MADDQIDKNALFRHRVQVAQLNCLNNYNDDLLQILSEVVTGRTQAVQNLQPGILVPFQNPRIPMNILVPINQAMAQNPMVPANIPMPAPVQNMQNVAINQSMAQNRMIPAHQNVPANQPTSQKRTTTAPNVPQTKKLRTQAPVVDYLAPVTPMSINGRAGTHKCTRCDNTFNSIRILSRHIEQCD